MDFLQQLRSRDKEKEKEKAILARQRAQFRVTALRDAQKALQTALGKVWCAGCLTLSSSVNCTFHAQSLGTESKGSLTEVEDVVVDLCTCIERCLLFGIKGPTLLLIL